MMSLSIIRELSQEAAVEAAKEGRVPLVLEQSDIDHFPSGVRFPNLGDYRPNGWELVRELFCDKLGFGAPSESALTLEQLKGELKPGFGYASIEESQFQIYLGEFSQEV